MTLEVLDEVRTLMALRYPAFVYSNRQRRDQSSYVPIFTFHSIEADDFERKLQYLSGNGYRTVTLEEVIGWMHGERSLPAKSVVLTIDDGRLSTWSVAYPLLERYGMGATAFVIPGYLGDGAPRPTLLDVWSGGSTLDQVATPERLDRCTVMNWSEVQQLHDSGVVSIEAHTMLHRNAVVSQRLTGFIEPDCHLRQPIYEVPLEPTARTAWTRQSLHQRLGAPIFHNVPVMSVSRACVPPDAICDATVKLVQSEGGAEFFRSANWQEVLTRFLRGAGPWKPRWVTLEEVQTWELQASKQSLESRLTSKRVRHLCYPKGAGSPRAVRLSQRLGYESNIWCIEPAARSNRRGADPYRLGRLKHDFIYRLPGDGRHSLSQIIRSKMQRRRNGSTGF